MTAIFTVHIDSTRPAFPTAVLPRHLGGYTPQDLRHALGQRKATRIINWLTRNQAENVVPFPLARSTPPSIGGARTLAPDNAA